MSGILSGLGIGGSSAKTDRSNTLQGYQNLKSVFNFAMPQASASAASGNAAQGSALNYWQPLVSGNRTAMTTAAQPQISSVQATSDAQKRQQAAMGTARGGGTAAGNQQRDTNVTTAVNNALFGARNEAAKDTATVGGQQVSQALGFTNAAGTAANDLTEASIKSRPESQSIHDQAVADVGSAVQTIAEAFAA